MAPRQTGWASPGTQRYSKSNIARDIAHQASACAQGLGSSEGCLCSRPVRGRLPCRSIGTWKGPLSSWFLDKPDRQHWEHRDIQSLTSLRIYPPGFCLRPGPGQLCGQSVCQSCPGSFALQSNRYLEWVLVESSVFALRRTREAIPGTQRKPNYNITWGKAHQVFNCTKE